LENLAFAIMHAASNSRHGGCWTDGHIWTLEELVGLLGWWKSIMNWKSRLQAIGIGSVFVAVGYLRIRGGTQVVIHWTGQPLFSFGLIAGGLVLILSAAIPGRLMSKLTAVKKRQVHKSTLPKSSNRW